LTHGHEVLREFSQKFREIRVTSADAKIAVVCEKERRAQYGNLQDLATIAEVLINNNSVPYHVIFSEALFADRKWLTQLSRYQKIVVLSDGLRKDCIELLKEYAKSAKIFAVKQSETNWQDELKKWLQK
jgi:hypothetical protein